VLTSTLSGEGPVEGAAQVVRAPDLLASGLNWRRGNVAAMEGRGSGRYAPPSAWERAVVPDLAALTWLPSALSAARRLPVPDAVITTSPPESVHAVGAAMRRRGAAWVADFRDGWRFEPPHAEWPTTPQRALDAALERAVIRRADACVGVTEPIAAYLREHGADAHRITNGFDPEDEATGAPPDFPADVFTLVHTGRAAIAGQDPRPLLEGVAALGGRARLVLAGPVSSEEERMLAQPRVAAVTEHLGALPRGEALALQRAADANVVIASNALGRDVATGKLFEYLAAGRPVLVVGERSEAARIVAETGAGLAVPAVPGAVAEAIEGLMDEPGEAPPANVEPYGWPALAERYVEVLERVASTRRQ